MDPNALFKLAGQFMPGVQLDSSEQYSVTEAWGQWNGHDLRFKFTDNPGDGAYRYNVTVYDAVTDEQIATGNGGSNWADAFSIVHWQEIPLHFPN